MDLPFMDVAHRIVRTVCVWGMRIACISQ